MKLYHGNKRELRTHAETTPYLSSEEVEVWQTVDGVRASNWATIA